MIKIRKFLGIISVFLFSVLCIVGCGNNQNSSDKMRVVTTIFAPYDFARQITADKAEIDMLMSPGVDTHSYEPSPQDIIKINECDVFVYVGGENDEWVDDILETIENDDIKIIKLMDCVEKVEEEIVEGMEHDHDEHCEETHDHDEHCEETHEHESWDEHVWTSPINAIKICDEMTKIFSEVDPSNAEVYKENLEKYTAELTKLDEAFKEVVNNAERNVMVFGDRFPIRYFTEEYGIEYYAAFPGCSSDTEASASTLAFLIDKVKRENISVIFKIELSNGNIAETISEATGADILTFYACHNLTKEEFENGKTYVDYMWENVNSLEKALN